MTKEKVIDILEGIKDGTACLMPNMPADGEKAIDIAIKAVEQSEPRWIPVTERPPKIGEYVLCMVRQRYYGQLHVCRYVDEDEYISHPYFDWRHNGFPDVVAWMPLPEPYKEATE